MTNVFVLNSDAIDNFAAFESALAADFPFRVFQTIESLKTSLADVSQAVVVLPQPAEEISTTMAQLKSVLSSTSGLAILPSLESNVNLGPDVDVITKDFNPNELQLRIKSLSRISELIANVEHCAQFDEITQLHNSRYFINRVNSEISLAKRHMSPLACLVIEVGFYQVYLDSYGYDFVNDLLKHIAQVVDTHKRHEDIVARIGDHEIAILLTRSTEKGARPMAKRIIDELESQPYKRDDVSEDIEVFAGVVSFPVPNEEEKSTDANSMLRYARHATHQAKCASEDHIQLFSEIKPSF